MNNSSNSTPTALLFCRYQVNVNQSLQMVDEWLKENSQRSKDDLYQLIQSGQVILKGKKLCSLPKLSWSEARELTEKACGINGVEIKDRRYGFLKYKQCFIGSELVDWLIHNNQAVTEEAIALGQSLLDHGFISHVCNDHDFKNDFLFYRFN